MKPTFCSLAMVAALVTSLVTVPADATRRPGIGPEAGLSLVLDLLPGRIEVTVTEGARPVRVDQAEGSALLVVNGRELGVALLPAGGNRLVGLAPFRAGDEVEAEISVTIDGRNVKTRYGVK